MAPMLTSADIASLITALPPTEPSKSQPTLVRSKSGGNLYRTTDVQQRFKKLLETSEDRVQLSDLPSLLDVHKADWLLRLHHGPIYCSRDGQSLLSAPEAKRIVQGMFDGGEDQLLEEEAYALQHKITTKTLRSLREDHGARHLVRWVDVHDNNRAYIHGAFAGKIRDWVLGLTPDDFDEGVDVNEKFPGVPSAFLLHHAELAGGELPASRGSWQLLNGRAVFVAKAHKERLAKKQEAMRAAEVTRMFNDLVSTGVCRVSLLSTGGEEAMAAERRIFVNEMNKRWNARSGAAGDHDLLEIDSPAASESPALYIAVAEQVSHDVAQLQSLATEFAAGKWSARKLGDDQSSIEVDVFEGIRRKTLDQSLLQLLLLGTVGGGVKKLISETLDELRQKDAERYRRTMEERVIAPIELYHAGLAIVADDTLRLHLEDYLAQSFREDILADVAAILEEQKLIYDKSTKRDYDKLREATMSAKTLTDLRSSLAKLAKKQKLEPASSALLRQVKRQSLETSLKTVRKSKLRGSDILQNLIWVLLACSNDGLYLSPGKDTSRMIRLCQAALSHAEQGAKLKQWRDALKEGNEDAQMLAEMREVAQTAVEGWLRGGPADAG